MPVIIDRHRGYHCLTLNRPERLNALTVEMAEALAHALDAADADPNCRAVLLTGAGRGFCAGQDLTEIAGKPALEVGNLLDHYNPLIRGIRALRLPVVCAVNGVAAGAGANLALACDIVLAGRSASFVQAFARIGLIPDVGGTWILPRLVGPARARALAMLAEPLPAETAAAWGMIWQVVDDERLQTEAHALAARLGNGPSVSFALMKQALDAAEHNDLAAQLQLEARMQIEAADTPDFREGVAAFLAKRPPAFSGGRD